MARQEVGASQNPPLQRAHLTIPAMSSFADVRQVLASLIDSFQQQWIAQFPITNYEGRRISNVGIPEAADDVVTLRYLVGTQQTPQVDEKVVNSPQTGGLFWRTIDIKVTTVGNNIADATVVHKGGTCVIAAGVLRKAITADLVVRLKVTQGGSTSTVGTFTIPHTTALNTAVTFTTFTTAGLLDLGVFTWDITASDGSADSGGVASVSIWWA